MGFFDLVSEAVGAVKNLVTQSSIVKSLAPLAGIVVQAVPMVGPIIGNVVPAFEAIFSKDNAAPDAGQPTQPLTNEQLNQPVLVQLDIQKSQISAILGTADHPKDELEESIQQLQSDMKDQIKESEESLKASLSHDFYNSLLSGIVSAKEWMLDAHDRLDITAAADPSAFDRILGDEDSLPRRLTTLRDTLVPIEVKLAEPHPGQQMLDLYLLGIHWLLIFNKAVVVTRGIFARSLFVDGGKWAKYIKTLGDLDDDITNLRDDAIRARGILQAVINGAGAGRAEKITSQMIGATSCIQDDWPLLSIGWVSPTKLGAELGIAAPKLASQNTLQVEDSKVDVTLLLWKEIAVQVVDFNLKPARAVLDNLEDSIRQWNSRIPVSPLKTDKANKSITHITASLAKPDETDHTLPVFSVKADFKHKLTRYQLTYSNTYGESISSDLSMGVTPTGDTTMVKLVLEPVTFANDPLSALEKVKDSKGVETEPQRAIVRRIYVGYTADTEADVRYFLGEVNEQQDTLYHKLEDFA